MITRRNFVRLAFGTAACAAIPAIFGTTAEATLDQLCWRIGEFVRDRNIKPSRVIAIDEWGRLVIVATTDMETDRTFHIADREQKYIRLGYRVEDRYLERAPELSVFVRTENGCHKFSLVFARATGEKV